MRRWATVGLRIEQLEDRLAPAIVQPLSESDPRFWADTGNRLSQKPYLSADGQRVFFESDADNLVPNDFNSSTDVFYYDRGSGKVTAVGLNLTKTGTSQRGAFDFDATPDGRYVVFRSDSADLRSPPLFSNFFQDRFPAYWFDTATGELKLVNISADGTSTADAQEPQISDDGRYVTFRSTQGVALYPTGGTPGGTQVFIRDVFAETTELVSITTDGKFGNLDSSNGRISGDGKFVAFRSLADSLDPRDSNTDFDLFLYDVANKQVKLATVFDDGSKPAGGSPQALSPDTLSADGRYLVYHGNPAGVGGGPGGTNAYLFDRVAQRTFLVSANVAGNPVGGTNATITSNGRFVTFLSAADSLQADVATTGGLVDVFLADVSDTSKIVRKLASVNSAGTGGGNGISGTAQYPFNFSGGFSDVTEDGRYVAFASGANNLAAGVVDGNDTQSGVRPRDVFVRDFLAGKTIQASVAIGSTIGGSSGSYTPSLSADGKSIAFESEAADLVAGGRDGNATQDVFVRDLFAGLTEAASVRSSLQPAELVIPVTANSGFDTTPDGRFTVFVAENGFALAPDVPGIGAAFAGYLFVRDRLTDTTTFVSIRPNGSTNGAFGGGSFPTASISDDGRIVAFATDRNDLDPSITAAGVYVRDLVTNTTKLISRNPISGVAGNGSNGIHSLAISPDGRFVAFQSNATNLIDGIAATGFNLYLFDRIDSSLRMLSVNAAGTASGDLNANDAFIYVPQFSADSSRLAFVSRSSDLLPGVTDTNGESDVFAVDLTGPTPFTRRLVSGIGPATGVRYAFEPSISADGNRVSFTGQSTFDGAMNTEINVFVRDIDAGTIQWASKPTAGGTNNFNGSGSSRLSADGTTLFFQSQANLNGQNPLQAGQPIPQLWSRDLASDALTVHSVASGSTLASDGRVTGNGISPNGRFVAFGSTALNLVDGFVDGNGGGVFAPSLYLRDIQTGQTVLVDANLNGLASATNTVGRIFLSDSGTVTFESNSLNLIPQTRSAGLFTVPGTFIYAFDFLGSGSIAGKLVNDLNADGKSTDEPGLAFQTVFLDANGNGRFDRGESSVTTDSAGNYKITNVAAGTHVVRSVADIGFAFTSPVGGGQTVTVPSTGADVSAIDFLSFVAPMDLAVGTIGTPATAEPGAVVGVSWVVRNAGSGTVAVGTSDAVYFSTDDILDVNDFLLAVVPHAGGLNANASYIGTANVTLPAVLPGNDRFIIVADRRFAATLDTNRLNNVVASASPTVLSVPELAVGTPASGRLTAPGELRYFTVTVAQGQTLQLALDTAATDGATELFVSRNALPTSGVAEFAETTPRPDQTLTVPFSPNRERTTSGPRPRRGRGRGRIHPLGDLGRLCDRRNRPPHRRRWNGHAGNSRYPIHREYSRLALVRGGTAIPATGVLFVDGGESLRHVPSGRRRTGAFDVRVTDGPNTSSLVGAFTLVASTPNVNPYDVRVITPGFLRQARTSSVVVEYTNTSGVDQPAPVLEIRANTRIRLEEQREFVGDFNVESGIDFLAIAPDGPAGTLRPGQPAGSGCSSRPPRGRAASRSTSK